MQKTTSHCLTVYSAIYHPLIKDMKAWMKKEFESSYRNLPHVSYAFSPVPEFNIPAVKKELTKYFNDIHPFKVNLGDVKVNTDKKFFYLELKHPQIEKIHHELTILLNNYRHGYLRNKDIARIKDSYYSNAEVRMIERFGYPRAFGTFESHVSIGNIEDTSKHFNLKEILKRLKAYLHPLLNKEFLIDSVNVIYYSESAWNAQGKFLWKKKITLTN